MKGKCSVVFTISEFNGDPQITARCLVRRANSVIKKNSNNNALIVKPKYEVKRLETVQYILALHNKLNELDAIDKATTKVRVDNLDAEFIHAKINGSSLNILPELYHGEYSINHAAAYAEDVNRLLDQI